LYGVLTKPVIFPGAENVLVKLSKFISVVGLLLDLVIKLKSKLKELLWSDVKYISLVEFTATYLLSDVERIYLLSLVLFRLNLGAFAGGCKFFPVLGFIPATAYNFSTPLLSFSLIIYNLYEFLQSGTSHESLPFGYEGLDSQLPPTFGKFCHARLKSRYLF
jgi:hypothetical protein